MDRRDATAVVVGSGPNGLTAAVVLAAAGLSVTVLEAADEIGGGARSGELMRSGVVHDHCSAIHPFGAASPAFNALPLHRHGLTWRHPEIDLAHPLDGGRVGVLRQSLAATADGLDRDGDVWRRAFRPLVDDFDDLAAGFLGPIARIPRHPVPLARFGVPALQAAETFATRFETDEARALFGGIAAHHFQPFERRGTTAVGLVLGAAAHRVGWPVAAGGSGAIAGALAAHLEALGGTVETGVAVRSTDDLPPADLTLLDTSPAIAASILGDALPARVLRGLRRWRRGPGAYKVDLVVDGGVPWAAEECRRAGTVHVGGRFDEVAGALLEVDAGRMPERPFVLVGQQYLADPDRSDGDLHPVWAYAQVPHGYEGDATEAVLGQLERFAPGTRDRIVDLHVSAPAELERRNANMAGGDIAIGANTLRQTLFRPRVTLDPYALGVPGTFLCSAATPPGPGVHGMCGWHAAQRALRHLDGRRFPSMLASAPRPGQL